jgi:hypothetical protein
VRTPDPNAGHERPLVSMEGWARFEERARQRRITRRLDAARTAVRTGRFSDARAALKELTELDPAHPEVQAVAVQLERAEKAARRHRGSFAAAVTAFATVLLAASWIGNTGLLQSYPMVETASLAPVPEALLASRDISNDFPVATSGEPEPFLPDVIVQAPPEIPAVMPSQPAAATLVPAPSFQPQLDFPAGGSIETTLALPPPVQPSAPIASTATRAGVAAGIEIDAVPAAVDDTAQVRAVLRKYQAAYERLDARQVHAVWPGVNEVALARAFEGLESQALNFAACDVQLRGATANVVCTGSTRYVPRIGSREPRVEPLAWNFTLRKRANDWEIESARAER